VSRGKPRHANRDHNFGHVRPNAQRDGAALEPFDQGHLLLEVCNLSHHQLRFLQEHQAEIGRLGALRAAHEERQAKLQLKLLDAPRLSVGWAMRAPSPPV